MINKFVTSVVMAVNMDQFLFLISHLESKGYQPLVAEVEKTYIKTSKEGTYQYVAKPIDAEYIIEAYRPDLFLALASMTDSPFGIAGEWWVSKIDFTHIFTANTLYKAIAPLNCPLAMTNHLGQKFEIIADHLKYFRKATKKELINYFNNKNKMEVVYKITTSQIKDIYDIACKQWRDKIKNLVKEYYVIEQDKIILPKYIIEIMFRVATKQQLPVLKKVFPTFLICKQFLPINSIVMASDEGSFWVLRFYAHSNYCYTGGRSGMQNNNTSPWKYIVPINEFDINKTIDNIKYSIV